MRDLWSREVLAVSFFRSDAFAHMNLTDTNTTSHSATHDQTTKYQYAAITVVSVKCFFSTGPSSITSAMSSVSRLPAIRCARWVPRMNHVIEPYAFES